MLKTTCPGCGLPKKPTAARCRRCYTGNPDAPVARLCSADGCTSYVASWRGLCSNHMRRAAKWGDPLAPDARRREPELCSVGGCGLRTRALGLCNAHYLRLRSGAPLARTCPCGAPAKATSRTKAICGSCVAANKKRVQRAASLRREYGITIAQYDAMLSAQGGRCAICRSSNPGRSRTVHFAVDHDHVTGQIRGLLCIACNSGIGQLQDDPDLLAKAAKYVRSHRQLRLIS